MQFIHPIPIYNYNPGYQEVSNSKVKHYVATFDISAIDLSNGGLFHNTMQCRNDNLTGQAAPIPEPGTMMLLGFGMLGLAIHGKRRVNKEA